MELRFVSYDRLGNRRGPVPNFLEGMLNLSRNELSTISLHYDYAGVNHTFLDDTPELSVETYINNAWVEIRNTRVRCLTVDHDRLEEVPTRRFDFLGIGESLRGVLVYSSYGQAVNDDGKVVFKLSNVGRILRTIWDNAVSRGFEGFVLDFTPTHDSAGQPWNKTFTISYSIDNNLLSIMSQLVAQGLMDYEWDGRTLKVYNPNTVLGTDKTLGSSPIRFAGSGDAAGVDSAPEMVDFGHLASHVVVFGEDNLRWEFATGADLPEGRREIVLTYSGVDDEGTARILADPHILKAQNFLKNTTRQFHLSPDTKLYPIHDYTVGDWVNVQRGLVFEKMRIYGINLQVNQNGTQGYVMFGDKIDDLLVMMYQKIQAMTGGIANEGSKPLTPKGRIPSAPTGVAVSSDAYIDESGQTRGTLTMNWAHNGKDTKGESVVIREYVAYYRKAGTTSWDRLFATPEKSGAQSPIEVYDGNHDLMTYQVMVRAVSGAGLVSDDSAIQNVTMEQDVLPPPKPSVPTVSTWLRSVTVKWDGKGQSGSGAPMVMPPDFSHIRVWEAVSQDMVGAVQVGSLFGDYDSMTTGARAVDVAIWYGFTAVDLSENESEMSGVISVTPVANVNLKEITNSLDAADIQITNIGSEALKDKAITTSKLNDNAVVGTKVDAATVGAAVGAYVELDVKQLRVSVANMDEAVINKLWVDVVNSRKITSDMVVIGRGVNGIADEYFQSEQVKTVRHTLAGWGSWGVSGANGLNVYTAPSIVDDGNPRFFYLDTSTTPYLQGSYIPVEAGQRWRLSAMFSTTDGGPRGGVRYITRNGTTGTSTSTLKLRDGTDNIFETPGTLKAFERVYTVPTDVTHVMPYLEFDAFCTAITLYGGITMTNMATASLIVDGAIATKHLTVTEDMTVKLLSVHKVKAIEIDTNDLTADTGFVGAMRTGILTSDSIVSTMIHATGGITSKHTITGATIQSNAAPLTGIKFSSSSFQAFGQQGATFTINALTGFVEGTGVWRTGTKGNYINMYGDDKGGMLQFFTGNGGGRGSIWARTIDGVDRMSFAVSDLDPSTAGKLPVVVLTPNKAYLRYGARAIEVGNNNGAEELVLDATDAAVIVRGNMDLRSGRTEYRYGSATPLAYVGQRPESGGSPDFEIRALEGGIRLVGLVQSLATYGATTTTPANMVVTASGDVQRSSSASRYKLDQREMVLSDSLLNVTMKDWVDKGEWERAQGFSNGRPNDEDGALAYDALNLRRIPGLIAEDLEAQGLEQFVIYGADGKTEGVMYDRFALAQIAKLVERVKALESLAP